MKTWECEGCDNTFTGSVDEAEAAGWDVPERFMSHCTCPDCTIDCTLWWRVVINKDENLSREEVELMRSYNQAYVEYNEVPLT